MLPFYTRACAGDIIVRCVLMPGLYRGLNGRPVCPTLHSSRLQSMSSSICECLPCTAISPSLLQITSLKKPTLLRHVGVVVHQNMFKVYLYCYYITVHNCKRSPTVIKQTNSRSTMIVIQCYVFCCKERFTECQHFLLRVLKESSLLKLGGDGNCYLTRDINQEIRSVSFTSNPYRSFTASFYIHCRKLHYTSILRSMS